MQNRESTKGAGIQGEKSSKDMEKFKEKDMLARITQQWKENILNIHCSK